MSILHDEGGDPWPVTVRIPVQPSGTSEQLRFSPLSIVSSGSNAFDHPMDTVSVQVTTADRRPGLTAVPDAIPQRRQGRRPAPLLLRTVVLGLLLVVVVSNLALAALELRPAWLAAVKAELHEKPVAAAVVKGASAQRFEVVTTAHNAITYRMPVASYTISLTIDHPCWVVVKSPLNSTKPVLATVLRPGDAAPVTISGSSSVVIAAAAKAITLSHQGKVVGVVTSPVLGTTYTFLAPTTH